MSDLHAPVKSLSVLFWGTYDKGKPRTRILLRGLSENGVDLTECHMPIWETVEDKSQIRGLRSKLAFAMRILTAYPILIFRFFSLPRPDLVVVGYLGHLDVIVLWPFARLRRVPVVWDAFLSLYDTVVCDRQMVTKNHPLALLIFCWEWLACRVTDRIILDTRAHADYFVRQYNVSPEKTGVVFVGTESEHFPPQSVDPSRHNTQEFHTVLFYGQFIPLHGTEIIIHAARVLADKKIRFCIVGSGQESAKISAMLEKEPLDSVELIPWIDYGSLQKKIHEADICLGIFGGSAKAARVIPNKVFQILHSGKPLITRDSPAIRELVDAKTIGIYLVPAESPEALANAIQQVCRDLREGRISGVLYERIRKQIDPHAVGLSFSLILNNTILKIQHSDTA
jgi:glycosyltransferase involved in cell wall biosynthesis